jgi:hypothetical protein
MKPYVDNIATFEAMFNGYLDAVSRFETASKTHDPAAAATYVPLFEALNWAVALDDRTAPHFVPDGKHVGCGWRGRIPNAEFMGGVRFARNGVHRQWSDALRLDVGARQYPRSYPLSYFEWIWRPAATTGTPCKRRDAGGGTRTPDTRIMIPGPSGRGGQCSLGTWGRVGARCQHRCQHLHGTVSRPRVAVGRGALRSEVGHPPRIPSPHVRLNRPARVAHKSAKRSAPRNLAVSVTAYSTGSQMCTAPVRVPIAGPTSGKPPTTCIGDARALAVGRRRCPC